jgi:hypothetical protein
MKDHQIQAISAFVLSAAMVAAASTVRDFKVSAKDMLLKPEHIYNFSGTVSVCPDVRQFGFFNSFAPPYYANPFHAKWTCNNKEIAVVDYIWYPSETILKGQLTNDVQVAGSLIPLAGQRAFVCKLTLENRGAALFKSTIALKLSGKIAKEDIWGWMPPSAGSLDPNVSIQDKAIVLTAKQSELAAVFEPQPIDIHEQQSTASFFIELKSNESRQITAIIALGQSGQTLGIAKTLLSRLSEAIAQTTQEWDDKIKKLESRLPRLITDKEPLKQFYRRSLLTFLTTQWNIEGSVFTPWYSESGIDGGAVCNYLWGDAYISKFMTLADPASVRALLIASMNADYSSHYAINFTKGEGLGVGYSYDYYSMAILAYDYITITGDTSLLSQTVREKPFIEALYAYVFEREEMTKLPVLIDYGTNENLLELHRTMAYQHYTPSPNLERVCSYQMIDELFRLAGRKPPVDLNRRADQLRKVIIRQLWDEQLKWFHCIDENQKPQLCYSIQIFDMLRANVLSRKQAEGLVGHLNEREFLSKRGVHSMSKLDPGYDPNDIDWGGPGVYAGDAPELVTDLLQAGFAKEGVDILQRILWWGDLPYIPQALRADARDYRHNGRANIIAAMAGPQSIIFGLFGIRIDGEKLTINPIEHTYIAGMKVENLNIRGYKIAITITPDGRHYSVDVDGTITRKTIDRAFELKFKKL